MGTYSGFDFLPPLMNPKPSAGDDTEELPAVNVETPTQEMDAVDDPRRTTDEYPAVVVYDDCATQEAETVTKEMPRVKIADTQPLDTAEIRRKAWEFEHRFDDDFSFPDGYEG